MFVGSKIGSKVLLYAFSPCKLTAPITVNVPGFTPLTIDAPQPSGYWLIENKDIATKVL
jgi:hypothetical protein